MTTVSFYRIYLLIVFPLTAFSQTIDNVELLLSYAKRFYKRQFLTRQAVTSDLLLQLEQLLNKYFLEENLVTVGIPTVQYLAEQLNYTSNYLSDMLRSLTN